MTHLPPKGSIIRLHKLGEYRNNGIYPGKNLITLFTHYDHRLNKSDL